jgi:dolichol-phosphate mannosyltransferase
MKTIEVLCPVFREKDGILEFHHRLAEVLAGLQNRYSITVMYAVDPSGDGTEEVLADLASRDESVKVLVMSRRFGHQAALLAGIDETPADALVMLDSDGQHPPELIPTLIDRWEAGAQIVQTLRQDGAETGFFKRSTSALFYRLLTRIGSIELKGGAADYRLLDRSVLDVIKNQLRERNAFLRGLIAWVGFNMSFVEFQPRERMYGASKYRASILFNFALQGISSFSKAPLRLCTILGIWLSILSILAGVLMVGSYLFGDVAVPGWATLMTFVSLMGGLQFLFIGIMGEYVGQIFDEVKGRPRYIVAQRFGAGLPRSCDSHKVHLSSK